MFKTLANKRFPNLACSGETRWCRKACGSLSALLLLIYPSASSSSSAAQIRLKLIPSLSSQSHSWEKQREAEQSPASPRKLGTGMLWRQTGTHCSMAQKLAGLGAVWRERVENNGDLTSEMEGHCFSSFQVLHPNDRSISSFRSY